MGKALSEMTLQELWMLFPIILTAPDPRWAAWYAEEEALLRRVLPAEFAVRISHIGSTAIHGIWAKPIVDILAEAEPGTDLARADAYLTRAGFRRMSAGPDRRSYNKGYTEDERLLRVEDYHLWYKFYAKGYRGYNLPEALYHMRDDRNATHRRSARARMNGIYATFVGFKMVNLPAWMYIYAVKNALVETAKILMPDAVYEYFHKKRLSKEKDNE